MAVLRRFEDHYITITRCKCSCARHGKLLSQDLRKSRKVCGRLADHLGREFGKDARRIEKRGLKFGPRGNAWDGKKRGACLVTSRDITIGVSWLGVLADALWRMLGSLMMHNCSPTLNMHVFAGESVGNCP